MNTRNVMNILMVLGLAVWVIIVGAEPPATVGFQGVVSDHNDVLLSGTHDLTFRLYESESAPTAVWEETQAVTLAGGTFDVALGEVTPLALPFDRPYWVGVSVDGGTELAPRMRLATSPYSLHSRSVVDNGVTTAAIADDAVTQSKLAEGVSVLPGGTASGDLSGLYPFPQVRSINGRSVVAAAPEVGQVMRWSGSAWEPSFENPVPSGTILMWAGSPNSIPAGWVLCDGNNNTPNLQDRFVLGVESGQDPGDTGGSDVIPGHGHTAYVPAHSLSYRIEDIGTAHYAAGGYWIAPWWHAHDTPPTTGTAAPVGGRMWVPPSYVIAYIMKQ